MIRSVHPGLDFARATRRLIPEVAPPPGISPAAWISGDASVDETASIGAGCALAAGVSIGPRSVLHPNVTLYEGVVVGADCVIHAGCVLRERTLLGDRVILQCGAVVGSDGFGYAPVDGTWQKIPQVDVAVLADDVEIGANAAIDRARFGRTYIGTGTKIDNQVQIAHNVQVGEHSAMAAQVAIAGSTCIGNHVQFGGQSGAAGHLSIPDGTVVGGGGGVISTVKEPGYLLGMPAIDGKQFMRRQAALGKVSGLIKRVRALERELEALKEAGSQG